MKLPNNVPLQDAPYDAWTILRGAAAVRAVVPAARDLYRVEYECLGIHLPRAVNARNTLHTNNQRCRWCLVAGPVARDGPVHRIHGGGETGPMGDRPDPPIGDRTGCLCCGRVGGW